MKRWSAGATETQRHHVVKRVERSSSKAGATPKPEDGRNQDAVDGRKLLPLLLLWDTRFEQENLLQQLRPKIDIIGVKESRPFTSASADSRSVTSCRCDQVKVMNRECCSRL